MDTMVSSREVLCGIKSILWTQMILINSMVFPREVSCSCKRILEVQKLYKLHSLQKKNTINNMVS